MPTEQNYLKEFFDIIAEKDPTFITEHSASKYIRQYWRYKGIKICVMKEKLTHDLISITITKLS